MKTEVKIGNSELFALLAIMITGKVFLSYPRNMALVGESAGWMIVIGSGILAFIGFFFLYDLLRYFPAKNILEISHEITGKWVTTFLGIIIFLFFLITAAFLLRQFTESFILAILPRTPIGILTLLFLLLLIYSTWFGIETISRLAWFFGPYLLLALGIIIAFSFPQANFHYLSPIFGPGPVPLITGALTHFSSFSYLLVLGLLAPFIRQPEKIKGIGNGSILIAIILFLSTTLMTVLVFSHKNAEGLIFPVLQLTRIISLEKFFQRIEALFVFLWFFTAGVQMGGLFFAAVASFAETFRIKNMKPLVFPIAVIVFTVSLLPGSMSETVHLDDFVFSKYYALIAFGIPLILWVLHRILPQKAEGGKI